MVITESQLREMVAESVKEVLSETKDAPGINVSDAFIEAYGADVLRDFFFPKTEDERKRAFLALCHRDIPNYTRHATKSTISRIYGVLMRKLQIV